MAGAGFDAEVTRAYQAMRGKRSYVHHYIVPILLTIQNISLPKIKVVVDGRQAATNSSTVIVSNVRTYGVGMAVASHALFDDGLFDACIFTMRTSRDLARMFLDILVGKHVGKKDLLYRLGRVISLDSDALVPVQLDGDFAGYLPLKIELKPQAVSIFTP
jgi:diacylglycerol kinase family enzyme